jgi:hypothetical protein
MPGTAEASSRLLRVPGIDLLPGTFIYAEVVPSQAAGMKVQTFLSSNTLYHRPMRE